MIKQIRQVNSFKRDIKRISGRGKKLEKLFDIVSMLANDVKLPANTRPHKLSGNFYPKMECHVEPDWLLIYEVDEEFVTLYRTGSHSDLF